MALLSEAQKALSAGQPERALQFLDEHARTFPRGTLAEERTAARIVALCKLGRVAKARSEAAAFLQRLPDSPLSERVRAACGDSVTQGSTVP
jgi:RNA polymerase sigma-70 factor (ECF subfamily)